MIIPIRIIDGLYLGDQGAAHDLEFLVTNKITKIINCAAKQVPNHWESIGIEYLSYSWLESEPQFAIDHSRCYSFINDQIEAGEAVLVHSIKGLNRSVFVVTVYLMRKFKWNLQKSLQFIHNLKSDFDLRSNVFQQLVNFEKWLNLNKLSNNWDVAFNEDEVVARNTYLNSQRTFSNDTRKKKEVRLKQVQWSQKIVSQYIPPYYEISFKVLPISQRQFKFEQTPIKLQVTPTQTYTNKRLTLSQLVDEQLQKKMNIFSIKSDRQSLVKPYFRPATAPSKRIIKGHSQSHRILKQS